MSEFIYFIITVICATAILLIVPTFIWFWMTSPEYKTRKHQKLIEDRKK